MGLALPALKYLANEYSVKPFLEPVLTLGRQCIYATEEEIRKMLKGMNIESKSLPPEISRVTNIMAWRDLPYTKYTSDQVFFWLLTGHMVETLDISDYENAEHICDLNKEIPAELVGKFGTIIDAGTIEHIFDVRQDLQNINKLLKPGGRVFHITPANNYLEHGYYQFSPVTFYDYYSVNGFKDIQCSIVEQKPWQLARGNWRKWDWNTKRPTTNIISRHMLEVVFVAEKTAESTVEKIPQQGDSYAVADFSKTHSVLPRGVFADIYYRFPQRLVFFIKRLLGKDRSIKPWGLRYRGKL